MRWLWLQKKIETYISLTNPFPRGSSLFLEELGFSLGKIMSRGRRSLSCPREQLNFMFLGNNHVKKELFLPLEHGCSLGQLKPCFFWEHSCSLGSNWNSFLPWDFFFIHFTCEWKNNVGKSLNTGPLGCNGDTNHCISPKVFLKMNPILSTSQFNDNKWVTIQSNYIKCNYLYVSTFHAKLCVYLAWNWFLELIPRHEVGN